MSTWRDELRVGLEQAGDQRIPRTEPDHPLYPMILAALDTFKAELEGHGVTAYTRGSVPSNGGQIEIWQPDKRAFQIDLFIDDDAVEIGSGYVMDVYPFMTQTINVAEVATPDDLAQIFTRMYVAFLQSDRKSTIERLAEKRGPNPVLQHLKRKRESGRL